MRAWAFTSCGSHRRVLKLCDIATPRLPANPPKPTYLIRISNSALNPATLLTMSLVPSFMRTKPTIAEMDFSGIVQLVSFPPGASREYHSNCFKPGTKVFGLLDFKKLSIKGVGTLAEYVVAEEDKMAMGVVPEGVDMKEAAALPAVGMTALKMCRAAGLDQGKGEGKSILVNGASGGVGTMAVQIAKAMGANTVVGICPGENEELVRSLGADEVIDYRSNIPVFAHLARHYASQKFDAILDTVGIQSLYESSPSYLKPCGLYVNVGAYEGGMLWITWCALKNLFLPTWLGGTPRKWIFFATEPTYEAAEQLLKYLKEGKVRPVVGSEFEFEEVLQAYDLLSTKHACGKIVIKVQNLDS
ncbi:NAD(P)-binding protein [Zopfia rhizophila CBS 207.26]|uniref:NAD(P)-binding protein n=1 Tax=Zopfia rhizophila CBS 207.26 TaxID=1314779 RepID=A0A6A6DH84_9PEZI|nr:NAD(P)-binding protein [Zopfia rhizophila CBS 207.26]